jgi:hypothetical protein
MEDPFCDKMNDLDQHIRTFTLLQLGCDFLGPRPSATPPTAGKHWDDLCSGSRIRANFAECRELYGK